MANKNLPFDVELAAGIKRACVELGFGRKMLQALTVPRVLAHLRPQLLWKTLDAPARMSGRLVETCFGVNGQNVPNVTKMRVAGNRLRRKCRFAIGDLLLFSPQELNILLPLSQVNVSNGASLVELLQVQELQQLQVPNATIAQFFLSNPFLIPRNWYPLPETGLRPQRLIFPGTVYTFPVDESKRPFLPYLFLKNNSWNKGVILGNDPFTEADKIVLFDSDFPQMDN